MIDREQQRAMAVVHMFTITCARTGGGSMACGHRFTTSATDSEAAIAKFEDEGWRYRLAAKGWLCPHHAVNLKGPTNQMRIIRWYGYASKADRPIISVGWLVSETPEEHRITMHITPDGEPKDPDGYLVIPKAQVLQYMDIRADRPIIDIVAGGWT